MVIEKEIETHNFVMTTASHMGFKKNEWPKTIAFEKFGRNHELILLKKFHGIDDEPTYITSVEYLDVKCCIKMQVYNDFER